MITQPTNHAYSGVSLPTLRLVLGLVALAISFYYSFKFLSVGTSGFELLSALAFVATKAMYCHDIVFFRATQQGDKTVFAGLIVLILFTLSITATVYFLLANPLKDDVKLSQTQQKTAQIKQAIDAKQTQLSSCKANYLTKCVNPRTAELQKLQMDYNAALTAESKLSDLRGVLLEIIGLALIAQATANKRIQNYNAPVIIQAGLGRLICEFCGADVARRTATQRFCCTPHRLAWHARARAEA